jgi:TrpR-related protein YerC/YecD
MTKISRIKLEPNLESELRNQLWKAITLLEDKTEVKEFLRDLLTRTEITMLSKRLEVIKRLKEGYTYSEISKQLNVSESTITKLHNWFEAFGEGYRKVIERLQENEIRIARRSVPNNSITPRSSRQATQVWVGAGKAVYKVYKKRRKRKSAA